MSRIGLFSDTHDNLDKIRAAITLFNQLELNRVIHCGDIVAPFVLNELRSLKMPLVIVLGNCDGDRQTLFARAAEFGFQISAEPLVIATDNGELVISHKPLPSLPDCEFYVYGHTHKTYYTSGKPVVVNPGEACGWLTGKSTVAVLDTVAKAVEFFEL